MRRRIVTGHDAEGRAVVISNGFSPGRMVAAGWDELWAFDQLPASLTDPTDPADVEGFRIVPKPGCIAVKMFTVHPPGSATRTEEEVEQAEVEWKRRMDLAEVETDDLRSTDGVWMHGHPTIDIIVVITGTMDLVLDGGETVPLEPGDSVIQRGTMHAWRNTGTEPCVGVAFVVRAE